MSQRRSGAVCHFGPRCATGNSACLDTQPRFPRVEKESTILQLSWVAAFEKHAPVAKPRHGGQVASHGRLTKNPREIHRQDAKIARKWTNRIINH